MTALTFRRREELHRRGLWLERFTVAWNVVEALIAIGVGVVVGSVALVLSVISILVMPTLAYLKGRTGRELGSRALVADSVETWVCAYLSVALLAAVGLNATLGWWWAATPWGLSPCCP